jgi:hypothetical protein
MRVGSRGRLGDVHVNMHVNVHVSRPSPIQPGVR